MASLLERSFACSILWAPNITATGVIGSRDHDRGGNAGAQLDGDAAEFCTKLLTFVGMNSILWCHAVLLARAYWIPGVPLTGSIPAAIHASCAAGPESAWTNDPAGPGAAVWEVIAAPNTMEL